MNTAAKIAAPIGVLLLGLAGAAAMVASGKPARKARPEAAVAAVEVLEVQPVSRPAEVHATGLVQPDREVAIVPQVSGQIVAIAPELRPGGRLRAGEVLAQIDPRDYRLAVRQEEGRVAQARLEYELELGRQATAQREWALLGEGRPEDDAPLALRRPQLEAAERGLESARAGLERAQLSLERTALTAPFNAMVLSEDIDLGQVVGPGTTAARLVGTDRFRVSVSLPFEQLRALEIPGLNTAGAGSPATVRQQLSEGIVERRGRVFALAGQLEAQTREATVLVAVDDPLDTGDGGLPLLPGALVDVVLHGRELSGAYELPRAAVYGGDTVWLVDREDRLARAEVRTAWGDAESLLVTRGLSPGDRVVTSPLSRPIEGAPVRISDGRGGSQ